MKRFIDTIFMSAVMSYFMALGFLVFGCATTQQRPLPPWNASMSDGCSVPYTRIFTAEQRSCCVKHDSEYYQGGSQEKRFQADLALRTCMIKNKLSVAEADVMFLGVRIGGGPEARVKGVSWAFGGERFAYSEEPAR